MSSTPNPTFAQPAWQNAKNTRTLRAFMALKNQEIGDRIRELRGRRPQVVVAEAIGASTRTLQTWEGGVAKPNYRYLQKLADYFEVSEGFILDGVDDRSIVEGVPEQLEGVSSEFSVRVDHVDATLARVEEKVDQLLQVVDALLTPRVGADAPETDLGTILAMAFQSNPEALEVLRDQLQSSQVPQGPARTAGAQRSR